MELLFSDFFCLKSQEIESGPPPKFHWGGGGGVIAPQAKKNWMLPLRSLGSNYISAAGEKKFECPTISSVTVIKSLPKFYIGNPYQNFT